MANVNLPPTGNLSGLSRIQSVDRLPAAISIKEEGESDFLGLLKQAVSTTNQLQINADGKSREFLAGETRDVHETMIALEKADLAFRFITQVRNKAVEAYREIIRMQL